MQAPVLVARGAELREACVEDRGLARIVANHDVGVGRAADRDANFALEVGAAAHEQRVASAQSRDRVAHGAPRLCCSASILVAAGGGHILRGAWDRRVERDRGRAYAADAARSSRASGAASAAGSTSATSATRSTRSAAARVECAASAAARSEQRSNSCEDPRIRDASLHDAARVGAQAMNHCIRLHVCSPGRPRPAMGSAAEKRIAASGRWRGEEWAKSHAAA